MVFTFLIHEPMLLRILSFLTYNLPTPKLWENIDIFLILKVYGVFCIFLNKKLKIPIDNVLWYKIQIIKYF